MISKACLRVYNFCMDYLESVKALNISMIKVLLFVYSFTGS